MFKTPLCVAVVNPHKSPNGQEGAVKPVFVSRRMRFLFPSLSQAFPLASTSAPPHTTEATLPRRRCPGYSVHKTTASNLRAAVPAKGPPRRLLLSRHPPTAASRTTPPRTPGRHPPREGTTKKQWQQPPWFCRFRRRLLLTLVRSLPSRTPPCPIAPVFRLVLSQQSGRSVGAGLGHVRGSPIQASGSRRACEAGRP